MNALLVGLLLAGNVVFVPGPKDLEREDRISDWQLCVEVGSPDLERMFPIVIIYQDGTWDLAAPCKAG